MSFDRSLNNGQKEARNLFSRWWRDPWKPTWELGGYAGTGKTYLARRLIEFIGLEMDEVLCMAYTGKAASNLSLKGLPASSIHSAIYDYLDIPKLDEDGEPIYSNGRKVTRMGFKMKPYLPKYIKLILIDECYFVNARIAKDILSFGLPVLVLGDPGQLPPIEGKPFFLNNPDYVLDELMRQSADSGIIDLATRIRLGKEIPNKKCQIKNDTFIIPKKELSNEILSNVEMIVCATNKTRNYFNHRIRSEIMGITSKLPTPKDKVICRSNMWDRQMNGVPLVNGTIGNLVHNINIPDIDAKSRTFKVDFRPDYIRHDFYEDLVCDIDYFTQECGKKVPNIFNHAAKLELGHAISCHLAQGSEFPSVLYYDDAFGDAEMMRKLRYTAATRAQDLLIYAI